MNSYVTIVRSPMASEGPPKPGQAETLHSFLGPTIEAESYEDADRIIEVNGWQDWCIIVGVVDQTGVVGSSAYYNPRLDTDWGRWFFKNFASNAN